MYSQIMTGLHRSGCETTTSACTLQPPGNICGTGQEYLLLTYEMDLGEPSGWWMTTADVGTASIAASKPGDTPGSGLEWRQG